MLHERSGVAIAAGQEPGGGCDSMRDVALHDFGDLRDPLVVAGEEPALHRIIAERTAEEGAEPMDLFRGEVSDELMADSSGCAFLAGGVVSGGSHMPVIWSCSAAGPGDEWSIPGMPNAK